jgi:hypothetical protein
MRILIASVVLGVACMAADDSAAVADFTKRVEAYAKLRDTAKGKVPKVPAKATPEQIEKYEQALLAEIQAGRTTAKQGDIFTPQVEPVFRRILKENFSGASNKEARAVVKQGNPKQELEKGEQAPVSAVNSVYPKNAPLSTIPPLLLQDLPTLPKDIEYRFSGQTLILRDNHSNLIIDFIKGASPTK